MSLSVANIEIKLDILCIKKEYKRILWLFVFNLLRRKKIGTYVREFHGMSIFLMVGKTVTYLKQTP